MAKGSSSQSSSEETQEIITQLKRRFEANMNRHQGIEWAKVEERLNKKEGKLKSLLEMENTGGEPDVVGTTDAGEFLFYDCAPESPKGRRSICYDKKAWEARKKHKPKGNAVDMATEMGIEILTEAEYQNLQKLGDFDTKSSSWLKTPEAIRKHGGAIFGDKRYHHVFVYHNGAESYYAARGFRGVVRV